MGVRVRVRFGSQALYSDAIGVVPHNTFAMCNLAMLHHYLLHDSAVAQHYFAKAREYCVHYFAKGTGALLALLFTG